MKVEFYNCPQPEQMDKNILPEEPAFITYRPDFDLLKKFAAEFSHFKNILVIGNGGSINPFYGFYYALKHQTTKQAYFLNTQDPDYIYELKQTLPTKDTLVLSVSKSGENTQQLEETMQFLDYKIVVVTGQGSPLFALAEKMNWQIVIHPPIGGRYAGLTEDALLPAVICGIDVEGLYKGASQWYLTYDQHNKAFETASIFWQLEQNGYVDVLMVFYAHALSPMNFPIVQLCHESFGKSGRGQSYFGYEGPEVQHHTMQRFFGGQKNISGFFLTADNFLHPTQNNFPLESQDISVKNHRLFDINMVPLEKAVEFEWQANLEEAKNEGIPTAHLSITDFSSFEIGSLMAFWQLYAIYSSLIRHVNPFDQPQVENSKNTSFVKRLQFKGLL